MTFSVPETIYKTTILNSAFFNKILSSLWWLRKRPEDYASGGGTNVAKNTSLAWEAYDNPTFELALNMSNSSRPTVKFFANISSADMYVAFDVLIDGLYFMSSNTSTPDADGLFKVEPISSRTLGVYFEITPLWLSVFPAGVHTFELYIKTEGSVTFNGATNPIVFSVREGL